MLRQSGVSNGVLILAPDIVVARRRARAFPLCRKMLYSTPQSAPKAESTGEMQMADQGLIQATVCAIVDKLNSGDVTPLDLLNVL
jgi:hypothetical protein